MQGRASPHGFKGDADGTTLAIEAAAGTCRLATVWMPPWAAFMTPPPPPRWGVRRRRGHVPGAAASANSHGRRWPHTRRCLPATETGDAVAPILDGRLGRHADLGAQGDDGGVHVLHRDGGAGADALGVQRARRREQRFM